MISGQTLAFVPRENRFPLFRIMQHALRSSRRQAAPTELRNLPTSSLRWLLSPDSDCAAERTCDEADPVSLAPCCTSAMSDCRRPPSPICRRRRPQTRRPNKPERLFFGNFSLAFNSLAFSETLDCRRGVSPLYTRTGDIWPHPIEPVVLISIKACCLWNFRTLIGTFIASSNF
jgi:hypothetical protein